MPAASFRPGEFIDDELKARDKHRWQLAHCLGMTSDEAIAFIDAEIEKGFSGGRCPECDGPHRIVKGEVDVGSR